MATTDFVVKNGLIVNQNLDVRGTTQFTNSVTSIGDFSVQGNTTIGNATTDGFTVNTSNLTITAGTFTVSNTATTTQTLNLSNAATASGQIKTLNLGTGGVAGSTTNVNIGSSGGGTTTISSPQTTLSGDLTVTGGDIVTAAATASNLYATTTTANVGLATGLTTGTLTIGGSSATGTITIDPSAVAHQLDIGTGVNATGVTKTVNLGTGGAAGSTTNINIGSAGGGTTTINSPELVVSGNLTINGTTTNINTTNLVVEDRNIVLGDVTTPTDVTANGGGITLLGATNKTLTWESSTSSWTSNQSFAAPSYTVNSPTGNITFADSGTTRRGIIGTAGGNDQWFVGGGASATDGAFLELATGDNATEPIFVRQYTGTPFAGTVTRELTLLDATGNTIIPGDLTVTGGDIVTAAATASNLYATTSTGNIGLATGLTSGTLTVGGASATGTITIDPSTVAHTLNIGTGANGTGVTKTVNIATGGAAGSTTNITIGTTAGSGTLTINEPILTGGPNGFIRRFDSGYSLATVANTLYEIGRFVINGDSHNNTLVGEIRSTSGSVAGVTRFVLNIRSNILPAKTFTFTQEQLNFGAVVSVEVWDDTLTGTVVVGFRTNISLLNTGWSLTLQERGNYNYFTQTNTLTTLDTTGLTQVPVTSPGYVNNLRLLSTTASANPTTGALVVSGGVGVEGALNVGTSIVAGTTLAAGTFTISGTSNVIRGGTTEGGQITLGYGNSAATTITGQSNNTWNIDVAAGLANNDFRIFRQNNAGATQVALQITESNGAISLPTNISSDSTTTGSLVVTGGVGVSGNVYANRLHSTVADGTAPLTVVSTTRVANLNVARAGTGDVWTTGRTLTIGNTGKTVDGSANVSWSSSEIGYDGSLSSVQMGITRARFNYPDGEKLNPDEEFQAGINGLSLYNNSGGTNVTITRLTGQTGIPNTTGNIVRVSYNGLGTVSPGAGGFTFTTPCRANARFIARFLARIPVGRNVIWASNSIGTNGTSGWITPTAGTGRWEEYAYEVVCGDSGTFSTTNFFYLDGTAAYDWDIASATVIDITDKQNFATGAIRAVSNIGSTSTTTGTLVVTGGAGISENLYVGGTLQAANLAFTGSTTSSVSSISAAGTTQTDATQITTDMVFVSSVPVGSGVRLPVASTGRRIVIRNNGAADLRVYPNTGAQINTLGANAAFIDFGPNSTLEFVGFTANQWYTVNATLA